jgi:hypothetical protein
MDRSNETVTIESKLYRRLRMSRTLSRSTVLVAVSLAMVVTCDMAEAARGGSRGGARAGAFHSGGFHHHHRHFVGGGFFFGATAYPYPWPYYYSYPPAMPYDAPPTVYVEQYPGTPTPGTQDWIYCPSAGASYPDVQECPGGWQRVFPNSAAGG